MKVRTMSSSSDENSDFAAPSDDTSPVNMSRATVLYDATRLFECAFAATIKCERAIAAIPDHSERDIIARDLLECKPHVVIILGAKWPADLYARISDVVIILLSVDARPPSLADYTNLFVVNPSMFMRVAPLRSEVSAIIMGSHLLRAEFPASFKDGIEDARYFYLALRASITSTLGAWAFVNDIVTNWQHVMEPENLVMYGRFLANVGPTIAKKRIAAHSVRILLAGDPPLTIRVIECPDFADITISRALEEKVVATPGVVAAPSVAGPSVADACIAYSLSADTTQCHLTCVVARENLDAASVLARIVPRAELSQANEITCATNDFFALVRASLVSPTNKMGDEEMGIARTIIAEGEETLSLISKAATSCATAETGSAI